MFGKLLKNDLKAQWHSMSVVLLCTFIVAVVAEIFTLTSDEKVIKVMGGLLVSLALGFACIVIIIAVAMMFSKTMFGRAGYLTLSLPVKTGSLLVSKTVSSLIWVFSVYALFIGSLVLWVFQVQEALGEDVMESVESILEIFGVPSFLTIFMTVMFFCISLAVLVLVAVQSLQLSLTLSHVSPVSKFGNLGAIIIFFVILGAIQSISNGIADVLPFGLVITPDVIKITSDIQSTKEAMGLGAMSVNVVGSLVRFAFAVALHFPTRHLIQHKINVK
ncbi:MAG: hypothetical protein ACI4VW_09045 [Acutalibacteraceae bacterium]